VRPADGSARASADAARPGRLRDTVRASELVCRTADEVLHNARTAIASSEQLIRSAELLMQALRNTQAHREQLRADLDGGGTEPADAAADLKAAAGR
jgi:hypothetical protein